jgi:putative SOS response-associated peptidase YedK
MTGLLSGAHDFGLLGEPVGSSPILTTYASGGMQPTHERVPVLDPPDQDDPWLDPRCQDAAKLATLLRPSPPKEMPAYRVSTLVNNPENDVPPCAGAIR